MLGFIQTQAAEELLRFFDGGGSQLRQRALFELYGQGLLAQAAAPTFGAQLGAHVFLQLAPHPLGAAAEALFEVFDSALVGVVVRPGITSPVGIGELDFGLAQTVEESLFLRLVKIFPGRVQGKAEVAGGTFVEVQAPLVALHVAQRF